MWSKTCGLLTLGPQSDVANNVVKPNKSDKVVAVAGGEKDSETKPSICHRWFDAKAQMFR